MKKSESAKLLDLNGNDLPAAISSVGGIYPVRHEKCSVRRILGDLRKLVIVCGAAQARALFRLFAFWLSHFLTF